MVEFNDFLAFLVPVQEVSNASRNASQLGEGLRKGL